MILFFFFFKSYRTLVVTNPNTVFWVYVVRVIVVDPNIRIMTVDGQLVRQQINPVWTDDLILSDFSYEVNTTIFWSDLLLEFVLLYKKETLKKYLS